MDKNKQQSGQYGQGQQTSRAVNRTRASMVRRADSWTDRPTAEGYVDPSKKNPSQDEQDERDRQRRAS